MKNYFLFCLLFTLSCVAPQTQYPNVSQGAVREEAKTHETYARNVNETHERTLSNAAIKQRFTRVAKRIQKGSITFCKNAGIDIRRCQHNYSLSSADGVNAYADGQNVYVTADMVDFTSNDTELAVVLGHEAAHNIMGHIAAQQTNVTLGSLAGMAIDIFAGSQGVNTGSTFSRAGEQIGVLRYSQSFEKEADYVGLYVTAVSGYDISKSPQLWRKMSAKNSRGIYMASSHPTHPERYLGLERTAKEIQAKKRNKQPLIPNIRNN